MAVVAALVAGGGYGLARDSQRDSDGDGLTDEVETSGWSVQSGETYRTDPYSADTDGDGLQDGDEAGQRHADGESSVAFAGYSNPLLPDSDTDGLDDAGETDMSLDPLDPDTDDDDLQDGREVKVVGSAPDVADTDGDGLRDGYEDANRESQNLDPLWFNDQEDMSDYVAECARGAVGGELAPGDSLAWLVCNLLGDAASQLPVVGNAIGTIAGLRDAVAAAIQGNWATAGYRLVGIVPAGAILAVPQKVSQFLARHPSLKAKTLAFISRAMWVPASIRARTSSLVSKGWGYLQERGATEQSLIRLQTGHTDLDGLAASIRRTTQAAADPTPYFPDGRSGEAYLEHLLGVSASEARRQVRVLTATCTQGCNATARVIDVLADGVGHESKVGYVPWSASVAAQIRSDAWLIKTGQISGARWHFFGSGYSNTVGADTKVLDLLGEVGIPFSVHLPAAG